MGWRGPEVLIRECSPGDLDAIVALDPVAPREPARVAMVERALRSAGCLVAERSGEVVGFAILEYSFFENGFVPLLYVAEPARRRGIGRELMRVVASRCRTRKLFTSTNQSNRGMQALLAGLGYIPSGIIFNLDPGDPELFYMLDLEA